MDDKGEFWGIVSEKYVLAVGHQDQANEIDRQTDRQMNKTMF